jgi:septal ring factor EnvC (AmiA/AmiB activator)
LLKLSIISDAFQFRCHDFSADTHAEWNWQNNSEDFLLFAAAKHAILFTNIFRGGLMATLAQLRNRLEQKKAKVAKLSEQLKDEKGQLADIKEQIKAAK